MLQTQSGLSRGAFLEEAAYQGYAMGNPARWRKFGKRILGIRRPVRTCLAHLNEAGAERDRWMAGVVADRQHFIAQRRDQQHIDLRKDTRHFFADLAAEP